MERCKQRDGDGPSLFVEWVADLEVRLMCWWEYRWLKKMTHLKHPKQCIDLSDSGAFWHLVFPNNLRSFIAFRCVEQTFELRVWSLIQLENTCKRADSWQDNLDTASLYIYHKQLNLQFSLPHEHLPWKTSFVKMLKPRVLWASADKSHAKPRLNSRIRPRAGLQLS